MPGARSIELDEPDVGDIVFTHQCGEFTDQVRPDWPVDEVVLMNVKNNFIVDLVEGAKDALAQGNGRESGPLPTLSAVMSRPGKEKSRSSVTSSERGGFPGQYLASRVKNGSQQSWKESHEFTKTGMSPGI